MIQSKIIQVVLNNQNCELLQYRLNNFEEVDLFLIVGSINLEISQFNEKKIIFCDVSIISPSVSQIITDKLIEICKNPNDLIILSQCEEFFDFTEIEKIKKDMVHQATFLKHKQFWWGKNYCLKETKLGSFVFLFSHLLRDKDLLSRNFPTKPIQSNFGIFEIENGWTFNGICEKFSDDYVYKNSLCPRNSPYEKLSSPEEHIKMPPNYDFIPDFKIETSHKILISFDENYDETQYSKTIEIIFSSDIIESVLVSENLKHYKFKVLLPNRVLYGEKNYEDFIAEFKMNEVEKIKNIVRVTDNDIFEIKNPSY